MTRRGTAWTVLAALGVFAPGVLTLTPLAARAQVIRGTVIEANRLPIADAEVLLRTPGGEVVARTVSGEAGRFTLEPASGGTMRLEASHLGHAEWSTTEFELSEDAEVEIVIRLNVAPIPLDPVTVETRSRQTTRRLADFERRMEIRAFGGRFLVEEDIARRPASRPSYLPLAAPGMTVRPVPGPFDRWLVYSGDCLANVYIDGVRIDQSVTSVDEYLTLDRIAGVEIYARAMSAPPQYQDARRRDCGTVVYWTKDLEPDRRGGWSTTKIMLGVTGISGLLLLGLVR